MSLFSKIRGVFGSGNGSRPGSAHGDAPSITAAMHAERRRSTRIEVRIPVFVYGYTSRSRPFHGEAHTLSINGTGGLIAMAAGVRPGQPLVITNEGNEQTQECEVVSVRTRFGRRNHIAVKFREPAPQFWSRVQIGTPRVPTQEGAMLTGQP